jgi:hypothetical protein
VRAAVALVALIASTVLAGCATGPVRAQVLDAETRRPIAGAVVLGVWTRVVGGPGGFSYHHELVGVRETETDADGRFELERLPSSGLDGEGDGQAITVYKFGYLAWSNIFLFRGNLRQNQRVPREIILERFPPGESHQRHREFINNARGAGMYGIDRIPMFHRAVERERTLP